MVSFGLPALLILGALQPPPTASPADRVPLTAVIVEPGRFQDQRVSVEGWCSRAFEESAVFLSHEDAEHGSHPSALWLDVTRPFKEWEEGASWRCQVEGRVDPTKRGHLGAYRATLTDITVLRHVRSRTYVRELNRTKKE